MHLTELFYENYAKILDSKDEHLIEITQATVQYLVDNHFSDEEIIRVFEKCTGKKVISRNDLPNLLWKGSLIQRGKYYYHHILHIVSEGKPFYLEMKIRFTPDDLLEYFIFQTKTPLIDRKQYKAQLNSLLKKFSSFNNFETLDFVLVLIDEAAKDNKCFEPFDLEQYKSVAFEKLSTLVNEATANGCNREVLRCTSIIS